jgi:Protein of unknown function (DUF2608)
MNNIEQALKHAGQKTLVIFDVDNTLLVPNDMILRPPGMKVFKMLAYQCALELGPDQLRHLGSIMMKQRTVSLVDTQAPKLIKDLQKRDIKVVALTAMRTGEYGVISSMEDWRHEELKLFDIDFSQTFSDLSHTIFHELNEYDVIPTFKHGIICSGSHTKGEVLSEFLQIIEWKPDRVIFIDDHVECLESVKSVLSSLGMEYLGFHYVVKELLMGSVDIKIAELQFKYLQDNELWLSDIEAKSILTDYEI